MWVCLVMGQRCASGVGVFGPCVSLIGSNIFKTGTNLYTLKKCVYVCVCVSVCVSVCVYVCVCAKALFSAKGLLVCY